jgi:hypothetical protein
VRTVLVRTSLVLACLLCSSASFADNCDSKCRMRKYFYVCPVLGGGYYWKYTHEDCDLCYRYTGTTGGGVCEKYGLYSNETCTRSGSHHRQKYLSGDLRCDCDVNSKWYVESFEPTEPAPNTTLMSVDRYVCPSQVGAE